MHLSRQKSYVRRYQIYRLKAEILSFQTIEGAGMAGMGNFFGFWHSFGSFFNLREILNGILIIM